MESYDSVEQRWRQLARATLVMAIGEQRLRPLPNTLSHSMCGHKATKPPNNIRNLPELIDGAELAATASSCMWKLKFSPSATCQILLVRARAYQRSYSVVLFLVR
jgi:hypothetical protein